MSRPPKKPLMAAGVTAKAQAAFFDQSMDLIQQRGNALHFIDNSPISIGFRMLQSTSFDISMSQITARLPDAVLAALDAVASELQRSRAEIVRFAIERYLEDFDDLSLAVERLRDPSDPVLDWERVRRELLDSD